MPPVIDASAVPTTISTPFSLALRIIPPALMFLTSLVSAVLLALSSPFNRDKVFSIVLFALNIVLPAVSAGLCIGASRNYVPHFRQFSPVFWSLHGCLLSMSSLYILFIVSTPASLVRRAFRFVLVFVMVFLTSETIAGLIPSAPALLAPIFSLISRGLLLPLAVGIFYDVPPVIHKSAAVASSIYTPRQQRAHHEGRVNSPTHDTWPFPASLAHNPSTYDSLMTEGSSGRMCLPIVMLAAQIIAVICASLTTASVIILEHPPSRIALQVHDSPTTSQHLTRRAGSSEVIDVAGLIIVHSVCSFVWAVAVVTGLYLLPSVQQASQIPPKLMEHSPSLHVSETRSEFTAVRTPKPSHSQFMSSDSVSDFLSMRDPFASPRPRPAPSNVGLGVDLDRARVCGVAPQYRFPAPKTKRKKGGRKTRTKMKALEHQTSTKALLPHHPHAAEAECSLKDEVLLAQLLFQSLTAGTEVEIEPGSPTSVAATQYPLPFPQPAAQVHTRLGSRWSDSTALSMTASTPWCEKKSMASTSASDCVRENQGRSSEARRSTDTGISISSSPRNAVS